VLGFVILAVVVVESVLTPVIGSTGVQGVSILLQHSVKQFSTQPKFVLQESDVGPVAFQQSREISFWEGPTTGVLVVTQFLQPVWIVGSVPLDDTTQVTAAEW